MSSIKEAKKQPIQGKKGMYSVKVSKPDNHMALSDITEVLSRPAPTVRKKASKTGKNTSK